MDDRLANLEQTLVDIIKDFRAAEAAGREAGGDGTTPASFKGERGGHLV
jgi:hypothetical protein